MKKYNTLLTSGCIVLVVSSIGMLPAAIAGSKNSSVLKLYNQPESPTQDTESDGWNDVLPEEGESRVQLASARLSKSPTSSEAKTYVVRKGDTIFGVAKRNGLSAQQFMKMNNLSQSSILRLGQRVIVSPAKGRAVNTRTTRHATPHRDADSIPHIVKKGETLKKIASTYEVPVSSLIAANRFAEGATLLPGRVIKIPVPGRTVEKPSHQNAPTEKPVSVSRQSYQVKGQDTFYSLARYYGVSVKELQDANPNVDPTKLKEGMTLKIPVKGQRVKNEVKEDAEESMTTPEPTARELHQRAPKITTKSRMKLEDTVIIDDHQEIKSHTVDPYFEYTVEPGDTWETIASDFKTSVPEIQRINRMENTDLENGFTLRVPRTRLASKPSKPSLAQREG